MEAVRSVHRRRSLTGLVKRKTVAAGSEETVPPAPKAAPAPSTVVRRSKGGRAPIRTATVPESKRDLRETFPRYAAAFDQASSDGSTVSLPETFQALFQILDESSADRPWEKVEAVFDLQDSGQTGRIDFSCFCNVVRDIKTEVAIAEEEATADVGKDSPYREETTAGVRNKPNGGKDDVKESDVELKDGKVYFKAIHQVRDVVAPSAEAKPVRQPSSLEKPMLRSMSEISAFALRTTILPSIQRAPVQRAEYKLTGWKTIRKSFSNYACGCGMLRFSSDGKQLAAAFLDGTNEIYDLNSKNLEQHSGSRILSKAAWELVMADAAASVASGTKKTFGKAGATITNMQWKYGGDRNMLASVDSLGSLQLWDVPQSHERKPPELLTSLQVGLGAPLAALAYPSDGCHLYGAGADRKVYCFDVERMSDISATHVLGEESLATLGGKSLDNLKHVAGHSQRVASLCVHPLSPQVLFSAGMDRQILLWDLRKGMRKPVTAAFGPLMRGDCMEISADGHSLLTGSHEQGQSIQLYDTRMRGELPRDPVASYSWNGDEDPLGNGRYCTQSHILACGWDAENKIVVAAGEKDNLARVFEMPQKGSRGPLHVIATLESSYPFMSMAISGDAESVAVGGQDGTVQFARLQHVDPRRGGERVE